MSDPFYDIDTSRFGAAELRRRQTVDHEACHVAAAVALGWHVSSVEVDPGGETGAMLCKPPPGRPPSRTNRELLAITMTPRVVMGADNGGRSGGDSSNAWRLAQKGRGRRQRRPLVRRDGDRDEACAQRRGVRGAPP
jgi:hypothetical protein